MPSEEEEASPAAKRIRRLGQPVHLATLGSVLAGVAGQATLLVSGVISARLLGVEDRGHLALFGLFPILLVQIGGLGLPSAATFYIARSGSGAHDVLRVVRGFAFLQIALLLIIHVSILALVIGASEPRIVLAAAISVLALPVIFVQQYGLAVLQGQGRFRIFNTLRLLPSVLFAVGVLVAAAVGEGHLQMLTAIWVLSFALPALWTAVAVHRSPPSVSGSDAPPLREMLEFGMRGLLGSSSPLETFRPDQAVVGLFLSPTALGLYVTGLAFTNLPRLVAQSVGMIAYPSVAGRAEPTRRRAMWRFLWLTFAMTAPIVVVLELSVGWLLPALFGAEFASAVPTARILLVGALFFSMRRVLSDGARGLGQPGAGTVAEIISWVCLIPALAVLVPFFGVAGVAWALTISSAISAGALIWGLVLSGRKSDLLQ